MAFLLFNKKTGTIVIPTVPVFVETVGLEPMTPTLPVVNDASRSIPKRLVNAYIIHIFLTLCGVIFHTVR